MNITQSIIEALESLNANKLRSGLTMLGIIIGVAAVIIMMALGTGLQDSVSNTINGIGTNVIFIFPGDMRGELRNVKPLTMGDLNAISDPFAAPSVLLTAPVTQGQAEVSAGGEKTSTAVGGVTPNYMLIRNLDVVEGESITEEHQIGRASVALIGQDTAEKLFGRPTGVVGESIRVNGVPFRIIGVLEKQGGSMGGSQDDLILVPFTTAQIRLFPRPNGEIDGIMVQAASSDAVLAAQEEIGQILRSRHRTQAGKDDFTTFTQQSLLDTTGAILGVITAVLGGIAAISLVVGGIGIMNIMLVSVTERTREIGLRKALGARRRDIQVQFLTESSMLSLLGGMLGIFLGWLVSFILGQVFGALGNDIVPRVGMNAIAISTISATVIGLFFGIYPASRAAQLEPVEALRYE
jgi:putative ABC transport system permease protein